MCPLSDCMAFIGGAWTPNILWHLAQGPRRFSELRADIPLVSAKVLTQEDRSWMASVFEKRKPIEKGKAEVTPKEEPEH